MNVWGKMITALRAGLHEAGEAVVDAQAIRILDQEVRDATEELERSKESLAALIARKTVAAEKIEQMAKEIAKYEDYAGKALDQKNEALALEVAGKLAALENQSTTERDIVTGYEASIAELREAIKSGDAHIRRLRQQVDTVKATEKVQKAQAAVAARHSGSNSRLRTALDSLERIKEQQALRGAQIKAANAVAKEYADTSLDEKLEKAGIATSGSRADTVLERLKKARSPGAHPE